MKHFILRKEIEYGIRNIFILTLLFCSFISSFAQNQTNQSLSQKDSAKLNDLLKLSWDSMNESLDSANVYADSVFTISRMFSDSSYMAKSLYYKAVFSYYDSEFEEVHSYSNEALIFYGSDIYGKASVLNLQGLVYSNGDNYGKALECYLASYKLGLQLDNPHAQANPAHNIGMIYEKLKNYEKALENYHIALKIRKEIDDDFYINQSFVSIGGVYFCLKKYDKATETLTFAISELIKANEDDWTLASAYNNLGLVYQETNQEESAIKIFEKCKKLQQEIEDDYGLMITYLNIAQTFNLIHDYENTEKPALLGIEIAKALSSEKELSELYEALYISNKARGNYKEAIEYQELFADTKDSILNESKNRDISELQIQYEIEKKEYEILLLKQEKIVKEKDLLISQKDLLQSEKENAESELKLSNRNKWILLLLLIAIVILFLGWYFIQRTKRNAEKDKNEALIFEKDQSLKAVIDAQEKERTRISKDLHDGIGQKLSGLKMAWSKLSKDIGNTNQKEVKRLDTLSEILDESASEVRSISHQMMPRALQEFGLRSAISDMLETVFLFSEIEYSFDHLNADGRFSERIEISLFRICQELINNCIKHSEATEVSIQLMKSKKYLMLLVEDNGKGADLSSFNSGHGFLNMKSRLSSINGEINLDSSRNAGLVAQIRVELNN